MSELMTLEEQVQDCMGQIRHLERYQVMYRDMAETEEDAGRKGQPSWATAAGNVEAYQKAIDGVRELLVYLSAQRPAWRA